MNCRRIFHWFCLAIILLTPLIVWKSSQRLHETDIVGQILQDIKHISDLESLMKSLITLQQIVEKTKLTDDKRQEVISQLTDLTEQTKFSQVRLLTIKLLWELGERGEQITSQLIKAIHQSPEEAQLALQFLPQIMEVQMWRQLMDEFERRQEPVIHDRLLRLLRQIPTIALKDFCRRLGRHPSIWTSVAEKLDEPDVHQLTQLAVKGDTDLQRGALHLLNYFTPSLEETGKLAPLLNHRDETVRLLSATLLARSPSPFAIPFLRSALHDKPEIAGLSSLALLKLRALKPEEAHKLMKSNYPILRAQGALALAPSRYEKDKQLLIQALEDRNVGVVRNASASLASKGEVGLNIVLRLYQTELNPERRAALLEGICGILHPKVTAVLVRALRFGHWREQTIALIGLTLHGDKAVLALGKLLDDTKDKRQRLSVVEALNVIGTEKALQLLLRVVQREKDVQVKSEMLLKLSNHLVKEAIPLLTELVSHDDLKVASDAAVALTRYGNQGQAILRQFLKANNTTTRQIAVNALASVGDPEAIKILSQQVPSAQTESQSITTLQSLARAGDEKALRSLIGFLQSENDLTRLKARAAIFSVGYKAVPLLVKVLDEDEPKLREEAVTILGALRVESAREKLVSLTNDPNPKVRQAATQALKRLE